MEDLKELSRLVFPNSSFGSYTELFVRTNDNVCYINNTLRNVREYLFNTWMNLFPAKKYYYYCDLGNLYLKLNVQGNYKLQIIGSCRNSAFTRLDNILSEYDCVNSVCVEIPNPKNYDGIYFKIIEDINSPVYINSGVWCTNKLPQRENKLAIITCTFKREDYINKNVAIFTDFINQNPILRDKLKLIVVDNGKTLDMNRSSNSVKIIPNMNAGGAGGFTRGIIDVISQNAGFSRVLFMDDDVEIFPESFYRTLVLTNYLKEEYKNAFINGAMLDLYDKNIFWENLAVQNKLFVKPYYNNLDISDYDNILKVNDIPVELFEQKKVSSAWWYHCCSLEVIKNNGLPVPVFFRGDDIEHSWKNFGQHHISMNGINVWHSPFRWRVSKLTEYYYSPRNMFFLNVIHTKGFKNIFKKSMKRQINYLLKRYDYVSLELFSRALEDILKGGKVFAENPEIQFAEINRINKLVKYIDCPYNEELERFKDKAKTKKSLRKLFYFLTDGGKYCPEFLFKKSGVSLEWFPPSIDFELIKEVKVYNLFTNKYEIRRYNRKSLDFYKKTCLALLNKIDRNYDKLEEDYKKAYKKFTGIEFWLKYLGLNDIQTCKEVVNGR